jgi:hypothetical protein
MKKVILFLIVLACITESCKKYPDGPCISLRSAKNRIVGTWKVDKLYINDIDSTDEFNSKLGCEFEFTKDVLNPQGDACMFHLKNCNNNAIYQGFWYMVHENKNIVTNFFEDSTFINAIGPFGNDRTGYWTILKLTNKEMKLSTNSWYDNWNIAERKFEIIMKKQ